MSNNLIDILNESKSTVKQITSIDDATVGFLKATWYQLNWGDLVGPAPSAIAVFGQLRLLTFVNDVNLTVPKGGFQVLRYANPSFRTAIKQLVLDGTNAFNDSHINFGGVIQNCSAMETNILHLIDLINEKNIQSLPIEKKMKYLNEELTSTLKTINKGAEDCARLTDLTAESFRNLLNLAVEINLATTDTQASQEAKDKANAITEAQITAKKANAEKILKDQEDQAKQRDKILDESHERLKKAVSKQATGWDVIAMRVVEKATDLAVSAAETYMSTTLTAKQLGMAFANKAGTAALGAAEDGVKNGTSNKPNAQPSAVTQPETNEYSKNITGSLLIYEPDISDALGLMKTLIDKMDWTLIGSGATGPASMAGCLQDLKDVDTSDFGPGPTPAKALKLLNEAIDIAKSIPTYDKKRDDPKVESFKADLAQIWKQWGSISTQVQLQRNKNGKTAPVSGPTDPPKQASDSDGKQSDIVQTAVQSAQREAENAQAAYLSDSAAAAKVHDSLKEVLTNLGEFEAQLIGLSKSHFQWQIVNEMLLQAITQLDRLVTALQALTAFFNFIKDIVGTNVKGAFDRLNADGVNAAKSLVAKDMTMYDAMRMNMRGSTIFANNTRFVMQKIAETYRKIFSQQLQPAMLMLAELGKIDEGQKDFALTMDQVPARGQKLVDWAKKASPAITDIVAGELKEFNEEISEYSQRFQTAMAAVLPPADEETKQSVQAGVAEHHERVKSNIEAAKPAPFKPTAYTLA